MNIEPLQSQFQLIGSSISNVEFDNSLLVFVAGDEQYKKEIDVNYYFTEEPVKDADRWVSSIKLEIDVSWNESDTDEEVVKLLVVGDAGFESPLSMSEEDVCKMLITNGCAALYSILRGFILSFTAHAGNGTNLVLPMVNIYRLNEEKQKEINKKSLAAKHC